MIQDYVRIFYLGDLMLGGTLYWVRDHRKKNNSSKVDDFTFGHNELLFIVIYSRKSVKKTIRNGYKTQSRKVWDENMHFEP